MSQTRAVQGQALAQRERVRVATYNSTSSCCRRKEMSAGDEAGRNMLRAVVNASGVNDDRCAHPRCALAADPPLACVCCSSASGIPSPCSTSLHPASASRLHALTVVGHASWGLYWRRRRLLGFDDVAARPWRAVAVSPDPYAQWPVDKAGSLVTRPLAGCLCQHLTIIETMHHAKYRGRRPLTPSLPC